MLPRSLHHDVTYTFKNPWVPILGLRVVRRGEAGADPLPLLPQAQDGLSCVRAQRGRLEEARVPPPGLGQTYAWLLDLAGIPTFKSL